MKPSSMTPPASKWNQKFAAASEPGLVAEVLLQNAHLLPATGSALDLACGLGGAALFLASHGLATTAWDSSAVALQKVQGFARQRNLALTTCQADLEKPLAAGQQYDVVNVSHYLFRPLCPFIIDSLKPGGLLFYQTWTLQKTGEEGPSDPAFLLEKGELMALFAPLSVVAYREEGDSGDLSQGLRNRAWLVARKEK